MSQGRWGLHHHQHLHVSSLSAVSDGIIIIICIQHNHHLYKMKVIIFIRKQWSDNSIITDSSASSQGPGRPSADRAQVDRWDDTLQVGKLLMSRFGPAALGGKTFQPSIQPSNLLTFQPSNLLAFQPSNLSTFQPSNLLPFQPANFLTFQLFNLPTCSKSVWKQEKCLEPE